MSWRKKRVEWAMSLPQQAKDFRTWMPGGSFLYKTQGEVAMVLQAAPRTKEAKGWCEHYHTP
eukprot:3198093-Lingulodinium_polyedra.AAC.1